jgi:hypothetical protein
MRWEVTPPEPAEMHTMVKSIPNPDVPANGTTAKHLMPETSENPGLRNGQGSGSSGYLNLWESDRQGLAGEDPELLKTLGINPAGPVDNPELEQYRHENGELRSIIAELHDQLEAYRQQEQAGLQDRLQDRLKEYESLLEEKSELIRTLHLKVQELEARPLVPQTPKEEELLALSEELDRERCQLQQERRQLEEERKQLADDEELMTKQMRDMEVQMARERADFARQRIELNRIYEEIRRELDNVERNGLLNQRLGQLRQRFQDVANGHSGPNPGLRSASRPAVSIPETPPAEGAAPTEEPAKRRESFLGRLFG